MSGIEDDGLPSGDFIAIEDPDSAGHRQALWVRVGPVFYGNGTVQATIPGIWISYQEEYMGSPLSGPVLLTPGTWKQLDKAVRRRLRLRKLRQLRLRFYRAVTWF